MRKRTVFLVMIALSAISNQAFAQTDASEPQAVFHSVSFDQGTPQGRLEKTGVNEFLTFHDIIPEAAETGHGGERLLFRSASVSPTDHCLTFDVPPSRVFDELTAQISVRTTCPQVRIGVRIRFPHQIDPRTKQPLAIDLIGESDAGTKNWQTLSCQTTQNAVESRLFRARDQIFTTTGVTRLDEREPYIDQVFILFQVPRGVSAIDLDNLNFGPIVVPNQVAPQSRSTASRATSKLMIVGDKIVKDQRPFFPIFTTYHGESLDTVTSSGVNAVWISNYEDEPLLNALHDMGIGAIAQPPQPTTEQAVLHRAGIPTFPESTAPVWAWMLGVEIPAEERAYVTAWADQVQNADRQFRRPILADVLGQERDFHRKIDLLGSSRFGIHTSLSTADHFEQMRRRRESMRAGKPPFTFVQTEASGPFLDSRRPGDAIPIVEPEQILYQGYEAIAVGSKAIGFWKQIPFDTSGPGLDERIPAMRILSLHCRVLEPWLATAQVVGDIPVQLNQQHSHLSTRKRPQFTDRWDRRVDPVSYNDLTGEPEIRAIQLKTDLGIIILLIWNEPGAQCVPGAQSAKDVRFLVGSGEYNAAWEVTPTSVGTSNMDWERVAGGTSFRLKDFDQFSIIVIPERLEEADALRRRMQEVRAAAAEAYVNLAEMKRNRVINVHTELASLNVPTIPQADVMIRRASLYVEQAQQELTAGRHDDARISSRLAMQSLRTLQRLHWEAAIAPLTQPSSCLEASCFQTLPDYWKMLAEIGPRPAFSPNILKSGGFESQEELVSTWLNGSGENPHASLRLDNGGAEGQMHLTMLLKPDGPVDQSAILISPEVSVEEGDIVVVTGKVKIPYPFQHVEQELLIYDTLAGVSGALRWNKQMNDWTNFQTIRRVTQSQMMRLRFELRGAGVAKLDDIQIRIVSSQNHQAEPLPQASSQSGPLR